MKKKRSFYTIEIFFKLLGVNGKKSYPYDCKTIVNMNCLFKQKPALNNY